MDIGKGDTKPLSHLPFSRISASLKSLLSVYDFGCGGHLLFSSPCPTKRPMKPYGWSMVGLSWMATPTRLSCTALVVGNRGTEVRDKSQGTVFLGEGITKRLVVTVPIPACHGQNALISPVKVLLGELSGPLLPAFKSKEFACIPRTGRPVK